MDKINKLTGCYFANADEIKASFIGDNTNEGSYLLEARGKIAEYEIKPFFIVTENFLTTPGFKLVRNSLPSRRPFNKGYNTKQLFYGWQIPYKTEIPIQTASGCQQVPVKLILPEEYLQNAG
jgi:hypothetical protein